MRRRQFTPAEMRVDFDPREPGMARVYCKGIPAGHAHLEIEGDSAKLIDIVIEKDLPHWNRLLRAVGFRANYRHRGAGTFFLNEIIARLRDAGARTVSGEMVGEVDRLAPWYRSKGFSVDDVTGGIMLEVRPESLAKPALSPS